MNVCNVKISSVGNGWSDIKSVCGEITGSDGFIKIKYSIDGDSCILTVKDGVVTQERSGGQYVRIVFIEGKYTECTIGSGEFTGSFKVFTHSLKFVSGKGGCKLSLEYTNGSDEELIKLTLTAVKTTP